MSCRMSKEFAYFLLLTIPIVKCLGQFYPEEVESKVKKEAICVPPMQLNATDDFEYTLYHRIPFTTAPHLDEFKQQHQEAYGKHKDMLHRIYAQPLALTRNQITRGVSSPGLEDRIQRLVGKLVAGEAVTIVVLGGSISYGHGVLTFENSWPTRLFTYINATFPNAQHQLLNRAIPATTSSFVSPCAYTMVPEDVDLIILEFTLNDAADEWSRKTLTYRKTNTLICENQIDAPARRSMERLIRELMSLSSQPAIINLHSFAGNRDDKFFSGVEDYYTTIAAYYGVTALSVRDAMYDMLRETPELRRRIWTSSGNIHPTCIGTRFMADLVIGFLMDQAAIAAWLKHSSHVRSMQSLPPAAFGKYMKVPPPGLPPPLFDENWGNYSTDCILDGRVKDLLINNVGFNWVNEGQPTDPKWGFVTALAGAQLAFKLPLHNVTFNGKDLVVGVGLLLSWHHDMGVAQLGCLQGCACLLKDYSTYVSYSGWSMTYWRFLQVKVFENSTECIIGVINSQKTYSDGHRVKVCSLMISGEMSTADAQNAWWENGLVDEFAPQRPASVKSRSLRERHVGHHMQMGGKGHAEDLFEGLTLNNPYSVI